jgi:hypothetical protein
MEAGISARISEQMNNLIIIQPDFLKDPGEELALYILKNASVN